AKQVIYGVAGHMDLRGHGFTMALHPGTAKQQTPLHPPPWDFQWQDGHHPPPPDPAGPGGHIRITGTSNNTSPRAPAVRSKQPAPRYVLWGEGTTDEMCLGMLSVAT